MSIEEVMDIIQRAQTIWVEARNNPTEKQYYDCVSLIKLAINKSDQPSSVLHAMLAQVHFDVQNYPAAWEEAENALSLYSDDYSSQLIKLAIALGLYFDAMDESQSKKMGFIDTLSAIASMPKGYQQGQEAGRKIGEAIGSKQYAKKSQATFLQELQNSVELFKRVCSEGIEAGDFIDFSNSLMRVGDKLAKKGVKLDENLNLYALIAHSPTGNISFESEEEKKEIQTIQMIANGRLNLSKGGAKCLCNYLSETVMESLCKT